MGIFINLNISDTITEDEWKRAYQKSVVMMKKMPFIETIEKNCYGTRLICATKTVEKDWYGKSGWHTIGDSISMKTAEDYFLPQNLHFAEKPDAGMDPYMSILPAYSNLSFDDARCNRVISLWGNKTQAEPYHFYLLAIACMLEHELPGKVAIYGDITKGQCKRAIQIAAETLGENIEIPDRCDLQRLYDRLKGMPLRKEETVKAFTVLYLGNQDEEFGAFVQKHFSAEEWNHFWRRVFGYSTVGTYGFSNWLKKYLLWGFQVIDLKEFVQFSDEEGRSLAEEFVKAVLATEVFLEEKDCEDVLEIDHDEEGSYSIYTLLAQFTFAGAKNHRVNRYIPLEELSEALEECVGDRCNISQIVTNYMKEHEQQDADMNPTDQLIHFMHVASDKILSSREEYDVADAEDLMLFENGKTIAPSLNKLLQNSFVFYRQTLEEERYHDLLKKGPAKAIRYLIEQNRHLLFTEESWQKIFDDIEGDITKLERYYPMVRVKPTTEKHIQIIRAIVLNDTLYQYCMDGQVVGEL